MNNVLYIFYAGVCGEVTHEDCYYEIKKSVIIIQQCLVSFFQHDDRGNFYTHTFIFYLNGWRYRRIIGFN